MPRDYEALSLEMLAPYQDQPDPRALRISGLYASLYLEDPFLYNWFGLACFVSRQIHEVLALGGFGLGEMLANGNLAIYQTMMPAALRLRDGQPVPGPLGPAMAQLQGAEALLLEQPNQAQAQADQAVITLCDIEQRQIVQPYYNQLPPIKRALLARVFAFRLGYDSAAPMLDFVGDDPANVEQRVTWMNNTILPVWKKWLGRDAEWVRADVDRVRRFAGVRLEQLVPRQAV
jgi:hypothetical protein